VGAGKRRIKTPGQGGSGSVNWERRHPCRRVEVGVNPPAGMPALPAFKGRLGLITPHSALRTPHWMSFPRLGMRTRFSGPCIRRSGIRLITRTSAGASSNCAWSARWPIPFLQGNLIIDEAEFVKRFPGESGHRMFLIDAPSNSVAQVSATLSRALQDAGLELTPAVQRLNAFNAVQNTYLGTFQVLGGLGLLLGSAGLGVVVLRNVLERRGELGLLAAVGFRRRELQRLVLSEHGVLLGLGLGLGIIAAAVAVLPAILSPAAQLPFRSLALTLGAVCANGLLWTLVATRYALRGNLLAALRNE